MDQNLKLKRERDQDKGEAQVQSRELFSEYRPVLWYPQSSALAPDSQQGIYSIKRNHGISGTYKLHNLNDKINDSKEFLDKIIIEYVINKCSYSIFTVKDLFDRPYPMDKSGAGNIIGELAERISRRITKYFLQHYSKNGWTGGIFDSRFDPQNRDDFIITHTGDYILKIGHYPNLILLKRTGKGKYGYENIKEIDGFFDYRYERKQHILVLESKVEKINVDCEDLVNNLFTPLRSLFPNARFYYVLFTDKNSIYVRNTYECWRQIKLLPENIHKRLHPDGIGTLFFTFNETRDDFEKMKDFLIMQYTALNKETFTMHGKTIISEREITIFDGGETPHIKLQKDIQTGLWREIPLRHKR